MKVALNSWNSSISGGCAICEQRRREPGETCCGRYVERLIRNHGLPHATIVLRTIAESAGNAGELIEESSVPSPIW
jgi:hypothetical protein